MKGFLAVLRREVAQRRIVFAGAAFSVIISLLAPLAFRGYQAAEVRSAMASVLAGLVAAGIALVLGFTMLGAEPSAGALRFLFGRPISGATIWAGKAAAALLLLLGTYAITLLPAIAGVPKSLSSLLLFHRDDFPFGDSPQLTQLSEHLPSVVALLGLLLAPALFLLAHAVAVIRRARTGWIALHALLGLGFAGAVAWNLKRIDLGPWSAGRFRQAMLGMIVGALFAGLTTASILAVRFGRTDSRRAHRVLSWALWLVLAPAALVSLAWTNRVLMPRLSDLGLATVEAPPQGHWVSLLGVTRWTPARFLLDPAHGGWQRLSSSSTGVVFSADASRAVWMVPEEPHWTTAWTLWTSNLRASEPEPEHTTISTNAPVAMALSPTGRRVAILANSDSGDCSNHLLSVFDVPSSRQLFSARVGSCAHRWIGFTASDHVRLLVDDQNDCWLRDFDNDGKLVAERRMPCGIFVTAAADSTGTRFVIRVTGGIALIDTATLSRTMLGSWPPTDRAAARALFLVDGGVATSHPTGSVSLFEPDGRPRGVVAIPGASDRVLLGGQPMPGTLLAAAVLAGPEHEHWKLFAIDTTSGGVKPMDRDLIPASNAMPGSIGNELFYDTSAGWSLIRRDPATGARRTLVKTDVPPGLSEMFLLGR